MIHLIGKQGRTCILCKRSFALEVMPRGDCLTRSRDIFERAIDVCVVLDWKATKQVEQSPHVRAER